MALVPETGLGIGSLGTLAVLAIATILALLVGILAGVVLLRRRAVELNVRMMRLESTTISLASHIHIASTRFRFPIPWSGWAADPALLSRMTSLVATRSPGLVIECGAGVSTLFVAEALRRLGRGRVLSLEHDPEWAATIQAHLDREGLAEWAQLHTAPLVCSTWYGVETRWYDVPDPSRLATEPIDLLLIDGPPGALAPLCRFPALPVFWNHLAADATILLDDADRSDELATLELWRRQFSIHVERSAGGRGFVLIRAAPASVGRTRDSTAQGANHAGQLDRHLEPPH